MMRWAGAIALAALMTGCASQQGAPGGRGGMMQKLEGRGGAQADQVGETEIRYGRIAQIDPVSLDGDHQLGVGHVLGAVAGGALGHQFGNGRGRTVAQVLGSLGGGYLGGMAQNKYADRRPGQHITVTLTNGVAVGITQPAASGLAVGDCVRIDGAGQSARVVRAECVGPSAAAPAPEPDTMASELRQRVQARMRGEGAAPPAPVTPIARPMGETEIRYGRIVRLDPATLRSEYDTGFQGAMNGVSGAALGHPVPGGDGQAFAQVAGTLGHAGPGAANILYASPQAGQLVSVQLDNGVAVAITQPLDPRLRVGERVRIVGAGPAARVTP